MQKSNLERNDSRTGW